MILELHGRRGDPRAHELLRGAHEAVYRFEEGFPGFGADLYYADDLGHETGRVTATSPGEVKVECDLRDGRDWARGELSSTLSNRWPAPYEQSDGRHKLKVLREDHPLGALIEVEDLFGSAYRVLGGHVTQVRRNVRGRRMEVLVLDRTVTTDGRNLPSHYCVSYWDSGIGLLLGADVYTDAYTEIGGFYLPSYRRVVSHYGSGTQVRSLTLGGHELLENGKTNPAVRGHSSRRSEDQDDKHGAGYDIQNPATGVHPVPDFGQQTTGWPAKRQVDQ